MFDYQLPIQQPIRLPVEPLEASKKPDPGHDKGKPGGDSGKKPPQDKRDDKQKVHTQMIGEKPGDDLGYDPKIIPTEPIPD